MKQLYKTLVISALLATPFAAVHAAESRAAHDAWIKAQKVDVKPTLTIKETTIPASSASSSSNGSSDSTMSKDMGSMKSDKKM